MCCPCVFRAAPEPEMGPPGTGMVLERIWNGNGNGQKSVPVLTLGPRAQPGTDRKMAQQRPQNGTAPFWGTNQSWQIRSSRSNLFLYRCFPIVIPFVADKPIKSLTWTNGNAGIGFGGAPMESTNRGAPLDRPILVQTLRTLWLGELRTMAGGGKRAAGKRLKKAGDIAPQGGEPPWAEAGTSKATEKGRKRRQGQETSRPSEAAEADQEQRPARERPGPLEAEGGQRELRCREEPGPSEVIEAAESAEAVEERRPA